MNLKFLHSQFILIFIVMIFTSFVASQGKIKTFYSSRYEIINTETLFKSPRLLHNYVECLLDVKPCPPEGKDLKSILPEALKTSCERCTNAQKTKALKVITKLYYEHPKVYLQLAEKYDPSGKYTKRFEDWYDEQEANNELHRNNSDDNHDEVLDGQDENSDNQNSLINRRRESGSTSEGPTKISLIIASATTTTPATTTVSTSLRPTLRTTLSTFRTTTKNSNLSTEHNHKQHVNILELLAPKPNGPISMSINKFVDTSQKVVNGVGQIVKSTFEIITGAAGVNLRIQK